jgi:hypothetical protein
MKFHPILFIIPLPLLNVIYAYSKGLNLIASSELAIILSSILYWTNLENSTFRILDIIVVKSGLIIHLIHCYTYQCIYPTLLMTCCMGIYKLGIKYNSNKIHSLIWIVGCISNYILISDYNAKIQNYTTI